MHAPLSILITGTSSGFGRRMAQTLARRGHRVYATMRDVTGRNAEPAQVLRQWAAAEGLLLDVTELDITDQLTVDAAVNHMVETSGRIDVVVNNAGTATVGLLEAFTLDEVRSSFETVAFGALRVDKAALPIMRQQRSGLLIHISSTAGRIMVPFVSPYSAAKSALEAFAEEFALELAPLGIDSVIVEPGGFPTEGQLTGSGITFPADQHITAGYGDLASKPRELFGGLAQALQAAPDPQLVADAVADLVDQPAGRRPLRTVVGTLLTTGIRELNEQYDKSRQELFSSLGIAAS